MKRELRIRWYALSLAIALLFPMGVGLSHALHEHDRQICHAESESHIHDQGVDCDHQHYFSQGVSFQPISTLQTLSLPHAVPHSLETQGKKSDSNRSNLQLRAPPVIIV